jgi:hypothetical protein
MKKIIGTCIKLTPKEANGLLTTKHINAPSCRDCKFSVWSLTHQSKNHEHFELKCIKFPYKNASLGTTVIYPNAFDCRMDSAKCGIEGRHYQPVMAPY